MSDMEREETRDEPVEIRTFVAAEPELIDPGFDAASHPPVARRPRRWLPLFLFVATVLSTWFAGIFYAADPPLGSPFVDFVLEGLRYSVAVMSILLAHEMGHFLAARIHRVPASLPYFIPMPISPLGTMGAVIVQGRGVADRRQMFDIAIAGPLAGLVLALPIVWFGLVDSKTVPKVPVDGVAFIFEDPLVMQWMIEHIHQGISENETVRLSPLIMAGWVGILVTALNLIPIGQLDGGHILYCLIGRRAHKVAMGLLLFAVAWMIYTNSLNYILLVILLFVFGPKHPPTADDSIPLGPVRVAMGWLTLAFIVIGFTPNPISQVGPAPKQSAPDGVEVSAREDPSSIRGLTPPARRDGQNSGDYFAAGLAISSGLGLVEGNSLMRMLRNSTGEPSDSRQI
ncbi:MAG: site-2 protease family protein [Planctomycetaceae bacterium]|nr:site-2 protease family protein [Planctomycetaceae bacterium]MBT6487127.1 site-2 protease family protein [Planctomycetaceae bacterium]MBT6496959.1 site-2 protease family protein [Planctomycetaceae bacterium]